jgi:hypothetical protein
MSRRVVAALVAPTGTLPNATVPTGPMVALR